MTRNNKEGEVRTVVVAAGMEGYYCNNCQIDLGGNAKRCWKCGFSNLTHRVAEDQEEVDEERYMEHVDPFN